MLKVQGFVYSEDQSVGARLARDEGNAVFQSLDRSHAPAWECRQGRSAFRVWKVTQSVTGCIPTQSVGMIKHTEVACSKRAVSSTQSDQHE
jgi:hypothetical protein